MDRRNKKFDDIQNKMRLDGERPRGPAVKSVAGSALSRTQQQQEEMRKLDARKNAAAEQKMAPPVMPRGGLGKQRPYSSRDDDLPMRERGFVEMGPDMYGRTAADVVAQYRNSVAPPVMPRGGLGSRPTNPTMSGTPKTLNDAFNASNLARATQSNQMGKPTPPNNMSGKMGAVARTIATKTPMAPGMKSGGSVGSASKRADGIATKGKTKGRMC
jgi:hypothetical protein